MVSGLPSPLVIERNLDTGQAGVLSLLPGWVLASQIQSCGTIRKNNPDSHSPPMSHKPGRCCALFFLMAPDYSGHSRPLV